jgi:hypothetical protein
LSISKTYSEKQNMTVSITDLVTLLSTQLYSDPEVFLRELICNSYDAILRRNETARTRVEGQIQIRGNDVDIVEVDDNGIGMRESDLVDFLSCIGNSATRKAALNNQKLIGRFGLGFLSVMAVANRITVETRFAEETANGHSYAWIWEGGADYKIKDGNRSKPGTIVRVELKKEYSGYASRSFLIKLVQKHVPFLDVAIKVYHTGDPRLKILPWQRQNNNLSSSAKWRNEFKMGPLKEWIEKPLYYFAAQFSDGLGVFSFPETDSTLDSRFGVCLHGVLVSKNLRGILPDDWNWVNGVVDLNDGALVLNRSDLKKDQGFLNIRNDIRALLQEELVYLCRDKYPVFRHLLKQHREKITNILLNDENLLNEIGSNYSFVTTLGDLTFAEITGMAEWKADKRLLHYIDVPPNTESRWAIYRATKKLLIWCQDHGERCLLEKLAQISGGIQCNYLTQISSSAGPVGRIAPAISGEMQSWLDDLREYIKDEGIHVEPSLFSSENIISILELSGAKPVSEKELETGSILNRFFNVLTSQMESKESSGRLYLNVINPVIQAMVKQTNSTCSLELAAVLLLTNGAVQTGIPIELEWQNILAKLTERGVKTLIKGHQSEETTPHVVCFFAHQFRTDKPVLAALRKVLEYEPYFWEVVSGEEETEEPELFNNVWRQLIKSHIFIGEVTRNNPNVLFETGLAFVLKDKDKILLLLEKGSQIASDLKGRLYFEYESVDLQQPNAAFDEKFRHWIRKQSALRRYKRHQPFLGYRLLAENEIMTPQQCSFLEHEVGEPFAFLAETPVRLGRLTGVHQRQLELAQVFFKERIDRYKQQGKEHFSL